MAIPRVAIERMDDESSDSGTEVDPRPSSHIRTITGSNAMDMMDSDNEDDDIQVMESADASQSNSAFGLTTAGHGDQIRKTLSEPPNYKMKPLRRQVQSSHHVSPYSKQHEAATASANKLQPTSENVRTAEPQSPAMAVDNKTEPSEAGSPVINSRLPQQGVQGFQSTPAAAAGLMPTKEQLELLQNFQAMQNLQAALAMTAGGIAGTGFATTPSREQLEAIQKAQLEATVQRAQLEATTKWMQSNRLLLSSPDLLQQQQQLQQQLSFLPIAGTTLLGGANPLTATNKVTSPNSTNLPVNYASLVNNTSVVNSDSTSNATELGANRRPVSQSNSAPNGPQSLQGPQYDAVVKQFQFQHQNLIMQQQKLYEHYLQQQQAIIQQQIKDRKHFESQLQGIALMHQRHQEQLEQQQELLRRAQQDQLRELEQQHQSLILRQMELQKYQQFNNQMQQQAVKNHNLIPLHRISQQFTNTPTSNDLVMLPISTNSKQGTNPGSSEDARQSMAGSGPANVMFVASQKQQQQSHNGGSTSNISSSTTSLAGGGHTSVTPLMSTISVATHSSLGSTSSSASSVSNLTLGGSNDGSNTGFVYDTMMLKHQCSCGGSHPEHPGRLQSIWARLYEMGIVQRCQRLKARKAYHQELQTLHSENHVRLYGKHSVSRKSSSDKKEPMRSFVQMQCGGVGIDADTYWNEQHTSHAAKMAVGSVIELADKVAKGEVQNGFAVVRPPGHHALPNQAMGFCYFNNVALAAKSLTSSPYMDTVLVLDWDIHHGNGTQQMFYDNSKVLTMSIHRYDNGTFFPGTGRPEEVGSGTGLGHNVNIALSGNQMARPPVSNFGDAEYLAAFRCVVLPIIREFNPDMILVSAGFNATEGHPNTLGGYSVTPACFGHLTRMLMNVGNGKVAMALEGGYELRTLCASSESCLRALLGDELQQLSSSSLQRAPNVAACESIAQTIRCHSSYWKSLQHSSPLLSMSQAEAELRVREQETINNLQSVSLTTSRMDTKQQSTISTEV